jgi:hypothetical protein
LWGTETLVNFLLNFPRCFLVDFTSRNIFYKNTQCSTVNLSISNTNGILHNSELDMNIARKYHFLLSLLLTCSLTIDIADWVGNTATSVVTIRYSRKSLPWHSCQMSSLYLLTTNNN